MEIKITTNQILAVLNILSWIIFVGLCIETCAIVLNAFGTLALDPDTASKFWRVIDLSSLYSFDAGHFFAQTLLISIVAILKTILFYVIAKNLNGKKLDMTMPFSAQLGRCISLIAYISLGIGIFSERGVKYAEWLVKQGAKMPDATHLNLDGADVWVFMSVTLFVIAQIFKRGIEIQAEHDLTV